MKKMICKFLKCAGIPALAITGSAMLQADDRVQVQENAYLILNSIMNGSNDWERIHAAEALLALNAQDKSVQMVFSNLSDDFISGKAAAGLLRVIARTCPEKSNYAIQELRRMAFGGEEGAMQIQATESLAKLRYVPEKTELTKLRAQLRAGSMFSAYSAWLIAYVDRKEGERLLNGMLQSGKDELGIPAADALSFIPDMSVESAKALTSIVQNPDASPILQAFALKALAISGKATYKECAEFLLSRKTELSGKSLRVAVYAFAESRPEDLENAIVELLYSEDAELRIAAAYAALKTGISKFRK